MQWFQATQFTISVSGVKSEMESLGVNNRAGAIPLWGCREWSAC